MRKKHIVVLALYSFLCQVGREVGIQVANIFGGAVEGIAQIPRVSLIHAAVGAGELAELVCRRRHSSISGKLSDR